MSVLTSNGQTANSNPPYKAEVLAAYNYYPFGMLQPGMYAENNNLRYRFGFNGMLRDDDVTDKLSTGPDEGRGNSYDFGARMYNPRVTRWSGMDPVMEMYPNIAPYTFAANNPILHIDPEGEVILFFNGFPLGTEPGKTYWGSTHDIISDRIGDYSRRYYDGSLGYIGGLAQIELDYSSTVYNLRTPQGIDIPLVTIPKISLSTQSSYNNQTRKQAGRIMGAKEANSIFNSLTVGESIKSISHSMGTGFDRGFMESLRDFQNKNADMVTEAGVRIGDVVFETSLNMQSFQGSENPVIKGIDGKNLFRNNYFFSGDADDVANNKIISNSIVPGAKPLIQGFYDLPGVGHGHSEIGTFIRLIPASTNNNANATKDNPTDIDRTK